MEAIISSRLDCGHGWWSWSWAFRCSRCLKDGKVKDARLLQDALPGPLVDLG